MLGGQLGGLVNPRLEFCAQSAPAGHVIAQHQQQPEVQGWAHSAPVVIPHQGQHMTASESQKHGQKPANASRTIQWLGGLCPH